MLAGNVKVGDMLPILVDGMTTYGIRIRHKVAEAIVKTRIPPNIIPVMIHHPRNLKQAIVGVLNTTEFEYDTNDINPYRQRN